MGPTVMTLVHALRRTIHRLRHREDGIAVPVVLALVGVSSAFVAITLTASVATQRGTVRDQDSKGALSAADAGANLAFTRQRYYYSPATPCVWEQGGVLVTGAGSGGWCPTVGPKTIGTASFSYRVSTPDTSGNIIIVSTGISDGVSRKVAVTSKTVGSANVFSAEGLVGEDSVVISGSPNVQAGVGTNGTVSMTGSGSICGNVRHGVGGGFTTTGTAGQCPGFQVTEGNTTLPPPVPPADIATNNSNGRFFGLDSKTGNTTWNSSTRVLKLTGSATVTLGGSSPYFICRLWMTGSSKLYMASGAKIRVFFDTPEHCGMGNGDDQITQSGSSGIFSTTYNSGTGFDVPGFYVIGSDTITTDVDVSGTADSQEFQIYAPRSAVKISGSPDRVGAIAAKSIDISGSGTFTADSRIPPIDTGVAPSYQRSRYVECSGTATSPPNAGC